MSGRHSSSQTPLPPQPRATPFSERKLQPLSETIMGLPAYGNLMGKKFTVEWEAGEQNELTKRMCIKITEVAPDRPSFIVLADVLICQDSLYIASVRNQLPASKDTFFGVYPAPPSKWKGFDFFGVVLEEAKKMALQRNIGIIETIPNDKKLAEYCIRHGFVADPEDLFGRFVYRISSPTA